MLIQELFDPARDIHRAIEKVITYTASQEARLKAEIGEYIVTRSIEEHFEDLLTRMQAAMDLGGENEVGVWVSGFYGSGKSSFTKYLGLALDDSAELGGVRFLKHLQDRFNGPRTRALLSAVASRFPAAVVMLDLASEQLAGARMEDVATVLYFKVLQWAGYSRNLKVAALERRLEKDGRYEEFRARIAREIGAPWRDVQNDPLVIDSLIPAIAHELYPDLFATPASLSTATTEFTQSLKDQVAEMLDIVRRKSGKPCVVFVVDEVGQYVGGNSKLILSLQGLAQNLKNLGDGKAWFIGTAQQTLTEDDPRAARNSAELVKLKDRFPIQIDLESSDIREICWRRLLGKSPAGEQALGALFDKHGPALRHNTRLQDARSYNSDFDKAEFANLYPFLPAHFDILLHLLGALARSTGGLGLRSAIKVIQDVLVEGPDRGRPAAEQPVGWLATAVTLYDALEHEIRRASAFASLHAGVGKAVFQYPDSPIHQEVAKTVAVLQILGNMPATPHNVASLMHAAVDAPSRREAVEAAVKDLIHNGRVPFGEKDGSLCFFSEKLNDIDQERAKIPLRGIETRRILNETLRETFSPLPSARLHGSLAVTTGLKVMSGSQVSSLAGERETIQTVLHLVQPADYEAARARLVDESRQRGAQNTIFWIGRAAPDIDDQLGEVYRCLEIAQRYRNAPDQEVKEYCAGQGDRAAKLQTELARVLRRCLGQGALVFRGQITAADNLDPDLADAARKFLAEAAAQVYERYAEAPARAETTLAEKFLRAGDLRAVTSAIDPLGLVQNDRGQPRIHTGHKALVSIRDYIDRNGVVEGKRLSDAFTDAPFGWSPDTLRYLVAALLVAGEIKLKVSGREVTVNGQQAIEALRTNNAFKPVGVALREERPSVDVLARAAGRLRDLMGDDVIPLEAEISKAATKYFTQFQNRCGSLDARLDALGLPGAEALRALNDELTDVLLTDASDAPQRLGSPDSPLHHTLAWAAEVDAALRNGLEATVRELQEHRREIEALPDTGVPGALRADLAETLAQLAARLAQLNFHQHAADLNGALTAIKARARDAAARMAEAQRGTIQDAQQDLGHVPEWAELSLEEQADQLALLDALAVDSTPDLPGLKRLLRQEYVIQSRAREMRKQIEQTGRQRQLLHQKEEHERSIHEPGLRVTRAFAVPASLRNARQLDELIEQLQALKAEMAGYADIEVTIVVGSGQ